MKTENHGSVGLPPQHVAAKTRLALRLGVAALIALGAGALVGCGQKGPLRLPKPAATAASAASAAR